MERSTLLLVDLSVAEKIDALSRDVADLKAMIRDIRPVERPADRPARRLRLPEVLNRVGVGKSTWWEGIRAGKYPEGSLDGRVRYWREAEIDELVGGAG